MPSTLDFVLADVFTDRPFGGNPLAVFPHVRELGDQTMQAIARELNLSRATYFRRLKLASDRVAQYLSVRPE